MFMGLFLDISQGAGLAGAAGVRPLVALLVAGLLGRADLGVNFNGTSYSFIESWLFMGVIAAAAIVAVMLHSLATNVRGRALALAEMTITATAMVVGALLFAASLADHDSPGWLGLVVGAGIALFTRTVAAAVYGGARRRLPEETFPWGLWAISVAAAAAIAGVAIALPPASYPVLVVCGWILVKRRRRDSEKYAGLRVLR